MSYVYCILVLHNHMCNSSNILFLLQLPPDKAATRRIVGRRRRQSIHGSADVKQRVRCEPLPMQADSGLCPGPLTYRKAFFSSPLLLDGVNLVRVSTSAGLLASTAAPTARKLDVLPSVLLVRSAVLCTLLVQCLVT